ncbi:MAG: hypothetical protein GYB24_13705 [Rhodobacteraceae bacterium]|nr:hypothetical protein [Paracoccaceae bacterium]
MTGDDWLDAPSGVSPRVLPVCRQAKEKARAADTVRASARPAVRVFQAAL